MARASLTDEDLHVLEFLAEQRVAVIPQVEALLGCGASSAERHVRRLSEMRLTQRQRIFTGLPAACWIRPAGLGAIGSRLPAPQLDLKGYSHDLGVGWLWLAARRGAFGEVKRVVSEREMRSADRRDRAPGSLDVSPRSRYGIGIGAGGRLHYPDLLLETASGQRIAIELELTGKSARRLDGIMLGFAADPRVDAVLYLCPPGQIGQRVQAAARRAGISTRVIVQRLAPGPPAGAPDPGRIAERRHTRSGRSRPVAAER